MSLVCALLLTLGQPLAARSGPTSGAPPRAEPALVRVLSGRVTLVEGEEIRSLSRGSAPRRVVGPAFLEGGPGSEFELSAPGMVSLRLYGPTRLEWNPERGSPLEPFFHLDRVGRLELEVRRGRPTLLLPQAWKLRLRGGAIQVRELSSGELVVRHHGGAAVDVESLVKRPGAAPHSILAGQRVRLPALAPEGERWPGRSSK